MMNEEDEIVEGDEEDTELDGDLGDEDDLDEDTDDDFVGPESEEEEF